jgi:di/tricarboxylate transporter
MTTDLALVLLLLAAAVGMFMLNRPRMDAVGLLVVVALPLTGVMTINEALAGFADPNIILLAALFVVGDGLVRTGVAQRLGDWLDATAGRSETRLLALLMVAACSLGSFMSSTAVVAIFIPILLRLCQNSGAAPRAVMMPLSVAALISGMMTLVATAPNLVVNAEVVRQGGQSFGFFSFTPFGLAALVVGVGYMLVARRLLGPARAPARQDSVLLPRRARLADWVEEYALPDREYRMRVAAGSALVGRHLEELSLREQGVNILAIERPRRFGADLLRPAARLMLQQDDTLLLDVQVAEPDAGAIAAKYGLDLLDLSDGSRYFTSRSQQIGMVEAILPEDSRLVGQTLRQARMRPEFGLTAIGLRRGGRALTATMLDEALRVGDSLLLFGFWQDVEALRGGNRDLVLLNLPAEFDEVLPAPGRSLQAVGCMALTIGLMVSGVVPNAHAALIGCLLMGLLRCVDMNSAYAAISWKTLVLIVGMMPFSLALQRTGGVEIAAEALLGVAGEASPRVVLAMIFAVTAVLGLFISNTATAVLMAPVALAVAQELGHSPYPYAMIVALAASTAFMTPVSSPVNTLVVGPGGYRFGDFVRVGTPLSLALMALFVIIVPWLLPL